MVKKDWRERIKVDDDDWFGLSLFIDGEGVFDEYETGGVLVSSAEKKLKNFIEEVREEAREEGIKNLIKKIEEANCDSISLELLREINLSKLTTK